MIAPLAPIALFVYKRPAHARAALTALKGCRLAEKSYLRIYCDGARKPEDMALVEEVRKIAKSEKWCGTVEVVERSENWGLSKSIRSGVGELCREFGRVIVLEDDLDLHPSFLEFMNEALHRYEGAPKVMQISGYSLPVHVPNADDAYFLSMGSCWGWGTWKRAWDQFDDSPRLFEKLSADPRYRINFDWGGTYDYYEMLKKQLAGSIDSWGIFWHQSIFQNNGLVLMPNETLVCNRGADGSGTHVGSTDGHRDVMGKKEVRRFPEVIEEKSEIHARILAYMRGRQRFPFLPVKFRHSIRSGIQRLRSAIGR